MRSPPKHALPGIASEPIPNAPLVLTPVEKFPEPEFSQLQRQVFADVQRESGELDAVLRAEATAEAPPGAHAPMQRLGAYLGACARYRLRRPARFGRPAPGRRGPRRRQPPRRPIERRPLRAGVTVGGIAAASLRHYPRLLWPIALGIAAPLVAGANVEGGDEIVTVAAGADEFESDTYQQALEAKGGSPTTCPG